MAVRTRTEHAKHYFCFHVPHVQIAWKDSSDHVHLTSRGHELLVSGVRVAVGALCQPFSYDRMRCLWKWVLFHFPSTALFTQRAILSDPFLFTSQSFPWRSKTVMRQDFMKGWWTSHWMVKRLKHMERDLEYAVVHLFLIFRIIDRFWIVTWFSAYLVFVFEWIRLCMCHTCSIVLSWQLGFDNCGQAV